MYNNRASARTDPDDRSRRVPIVTNRIVSYSAGEQGRGGGLFFFCFYYYYYQLFFFYARPCHRRRRRL